MKQKRRSSAADSGEAVTQLILETFRLNGRLLAAGDALVAAVGLTSARWQVLGAVAATLLPIPVAHIARNMGLSRQAVQRLVNEMEADGLVRFAPNPHHERAKLVVMTKRGEDVFRAAMERQIPWAKELATHMKPDDIQAAVRMLRMLRERLEEQ